MVKLPFVVEPRRQPIMEKIGNEDSGIIEIERRGYLTTGEKSFVQQVQQFDNGTTEIVTVSRRVARRYSLGMDRAYRMVLAIISGVNQENEEDNALAAEIEAEFATDLTSVVKGLANSKAREELVFAACMLKYRIDPGFEIDQISSLHPDIIEGLAALYREEESRLVDAFQEKTPEEEAAPSIEEVEKKPSKTTGSRSKTTTGG
jgi:hypothetical protein